ncbi:MAG: trimeric intracellular cation channel family protein [Barnesiella sp.]|nr:trimeric intracellular cation channel family protein [Bacteroidales bacterium]MBD5247006.1 trimeric intracellular cation channel family protein [Barnesiella sp.]MBD5257682.1 trimeric intracellular cation channel family protein [Barnesiella sp.]
MDTTFLFIIELVGTFAFAISGIRMAAYKNFDLFGAYVIGLVTAIGGGTLRDVLLDIPVFWMQTITYLAITGASLIIVILFRRILISMNRMLFFFDTVGLALFVVIGIQKTLAVDYPMWVALVMGVITGSFGGVVRDILINVEPLFFRKDIYATACLAGGFAYWGSDAIGMSDVVSQSLCGITIIILRMLAIRYNWSLPQLRYNTENESETTDPNNRTDRS